MLCDLQAELFQARGGGREVRLQARQRLGTSEEVYLARGVRIARAFEMPKGF